ncbi:hypothetical protein BOTBODRAFT_34801 [Botryobasidium botryosum FD-172 SS1]|uniref:Uncharacterized protein n=1 Tax=Botryobasidium botryosum (strain FD-172 SS1) TaxID=930990 RepID=A0A067MJZ3_BOTB1|nr:hypothetical protein BOTBODRAFT_34801 [Botryobasidium botryosum FD-172 SS1]
MVLAVLCALIDQGPSSAPPPLNNNGNLKPSLQMSYCWRTRLATPGMLGSLIIKFKVGTTSAYSYYTVSTITATYTPTSTIGGGDLDRVSTPEVQTLST